MPATPKHDTRVLRGPPLNLPLLLELGYAKAVLLPHTQWHASKGYRITFLLGGALSWELGRHETVALSAGQLLLIPRGMQHRLCEPPGTLAPMFWLDFNPAVQYANRNTSFTNDELADIAHLLLGAGVRTGVGSDLLRRILDQVVSLQPTSTEHPVEASSLPWLRTLLCQAVIESTHCIFDLHVAAKNTEHIAAAQAFMSKHIQDDISINDVAAHIGYSPSRTYELFKASTGLTPNDYLNRLRVDRSAELLSNSTLSITEIAFAVGFSSSQYLARVFRKYKGSSPSEYRRQGGDHGHESTL